MIEKQLKSLIVDSKKSLNSIAKNAGVDYATLHRFVNDGRKVQINFVESLCKYFGVELGCTDRQVKSLLRALAIDAIRKSGKELKHKNGKVDTGKLQSYLDSLGDLSENSPDPVKNLAASRFNELNVARQRELTLDTVRSIGFSDAMYKANQKWLHELDQAIPEFRNAYNSMKPDQRKTLKEYLMKLVEAESLQRKLLGTHEFVLSTSVGYEHFDEQGEETDAYWVKIKPKVMLAAVEAWEKDEDFTPHSFRQFI